MIPGSSRINPVYNILMRLGSLVILFSLGWPVSALAIHEQSNREIVEGDIVPWMPEKTIQGNAIMIPANEGITVVLFWATWSSRSKQALELWNKFKDDYADQSLTIITVNAERDELSSQELQSIDQYIVENIPNLPVVLDGGLNLFNTYAVIALPTAFFLESSGKVLYRYPSFPASAALDLQEELEVTLGLRKRQTQEEEASRGKLEYQPKNNALLYYNLGVRLYKKGFREKALQRIIIALQRDPEYQDPLRAMEGIFFGDGRTPEDEARLKTFLMENGLDGQVDRIGEGKPLLIEVPKKIDATERMRQLMEKNAPSPGSSR
ncbi:MAG: TlpA disulfide reductase family protein [bacterium]|nr:TlpA disulfide reductase family protein [bacterium]MDT8364997.1 TlpA disulfide reductase family protein [bacterium]